MPSPFAICIVAIVSLGALGLPIGHSMIAGSILYLLLSGLDLGTAAEQILNGLFNSYVLLAIPLFILAADLMNIGSLTDRLLQFCLVLVGRFRGGLGHVNVVANMIFAGMSGSAIADAVGIGRIIIGMMTREGRYPIAYAGAITASAAIIGPIIPPSIPMVLYALISDTSIGYLFLGGFVPGVMLGIGFMVANSIIARRRNYPVEPPIPVREIPRITLRAFPALMLPVILLFGIYGGVMTPTEGAAAAAFYALFASTVLYRAVSWRQLYDALLASGKATTSIGMLIAGALVFNYVVTIENIPASLARVMAGQDFSATMFLVVVNIILLSRLFARRQHDSACRGADLHSHGEGAWYRPRAFRPGGGGQYHDRPADTPLRVAAVRARQHDQATIGGDRSRGRTFHCYGDPRTRDHHLRSGFNSLVAAALGIQRLRAHINETHLHLEWSQS